MSDERGCEIIVGRNDDEGRTWCRTCEQHVRVRAPRQFYESDGYRVACPRNEPVATIVSTSSDVSL